VREWLRRCSLRAARDVATAWRDFRLARGAMTYDDQIRLARALLQKPEAARRIRGKNYRVILDEAQDTDPEQFATLLEITRPPGATGSWIEGAKGPPRLGHFCMVGDFQQSIFGERADLAFYRRVHNALLRDGAGEELKFSVTFRLDDAQIGFVNDAFIGVLNDTGGQVGFVHLNARPQSLPGQVVRFDPGAPPEDDGQIEWQRARFEAEKVAGWVREQGLDRLRAQTWRDVAILCPRKGWFAPLKEALRRHGFNVQLQSESDIKGDSPACAWLTALVTIMAEPAYGYEIVGVLREIFGLSDHDLAVFANGRGERWQISRPVSGGGPVTDTLNLLVETRARIIALPLFSAIEELVCATQLRERLLILPAEEFEDLGAELDDLLTLAAAAEAQAGTLPEFAAELRTRFATTREVRSGARDAIQLITCHKAKGSEWQAVVVPFFGRGILQRNRIYPRLLRDPGTSEVVAVLDRAHLDETMKEAIETQQRQELERLLYVTLSRAKHTLVIVDDRALFHRRNGLPKNAAARLLGCAEATHLCTRFENLPTLAEPCSGTITAQRTLAARRAPGQSVVALAPITHDTLANARVRAAHFRKRNPSALAELALIEAEEAAPWKLFRRTVAGPTAGTRYGIWWHDFVERLDWQAGVAQWDTRFTDALVDSPDPDLSRREWALLRTQLSTRSDLAARLVAPGTIAHAEMPFLWAMNDRDVIEGIIDVAIFDPARGHWLIVDWKTNRTTRKTLPDLRTHYLPQISAYWKAVTSMLDAPVTAALYSTATGAWLPCEAAEISAAWDALEGSSAALAMVLSEP
jgi:ATP-dependent exoDNAse (exonuclease V) beta subunit